MFLSLYELKMRFPHYCIFFTQIKEPTGRFVLESVRTFVRRNYPEEAIEASAYIIYPSPEVT